MSLAEVAARTKIQLRTLELIEAAQFESLPADVFLRGFIKGYARAVGLGEDEALDRYATCGKEPGPVAAQRRAEAAARGVQYAQSTPAATVPFAEASVADAAANVGRRDDAYQGNAAGSLTSMAVPAWAGSQAAETAQSGRAVAEAYVAAVTPTPLVVAAVAPVVAEAKPARRRRTTKTASAAPASAIVVVADAPSGRTVTAGEVAAAAWASAWSSPVPVVTSAVADSSTPKRSRRKTAAAPEPTAADQSPNQAPAAPRRRTKTSTAPANLAAPASLAADDAPTTRKRKPAVKRGPVSGANEMATVEAPVVTPAQQLALPTIAPRETDAVVTPLRGLASISEAIEGEFEVAEALVGAPAAAPAGLWDPPPSPRFRADSVGGVAPISIPTAIVDEAGHRLVLAPVAQPIVAMAAATDSVDHDVDVDGLDDGLDDEPTHEAPTSQAAVTAGDRIANLPEWFAATSAGEADDESEAENVVVAASPTDTVTDTLVEVQVPDESLVYGPAVRIRAVAAAPAEWSAGTPTVEAVANANSGAATTAASGWSLASVSSALAARRASARGGVALVIDDDNPERAERDQLSRERERADRGRTNFLPPILRDQERQARQGGLTLAVIILLIVATLTLSYLMRRPSSTGEGITRAATPAAELG